jgi:hypothetical protein
LEYSYYNIKNIYSFSFIVDAILKVTKCMTKKLTRNPDISACNNKFEQR